MIQLEHTLGILLQHAGSLVHGPTLHHLRPLKDVVLGLWCAVLLNPLSAGQVVDPGVH